MKITNIHDLPQAFVELAQQEYEVAPNEYRVTSLLRGFRETQLFRRHHEEITVDVSDMVWALFGTAVHDVLERQKETDSELKEERLKVPVGDYLLSGKFDLYCLEKRELTDYKTTSVWKIVYKDYEEWRKQQLIYGWMMINDIGFPVERGKVTAFLKDHSKSKAKFDKDYPQLPVHTVKFTFTSKEFEDTGIWLYETFKTIAELEKLPDDELPICTQQERWNNGDKWAVMKKGRKSALRVLDSEGDAYLWMEANEKGGYVEHRPGLDRKCTEYCHVNSFCSYYKERYVKEVV